MDDNFTSQLHTQIGALRVKTDEQQIENFLNRCAQVRAEWLQKEIRGELGGIEQQNRKRFLTLLQQHLPALIKPNEEEPRGESSPLQVDSEADDAEIDHEETPKSPETRPVNNQDGDEHFSDFQRRQEEAMRAAFQASEQDDNSPGADIENLDPDALLMATEKPPDRTLNTSSGHLSLHQPTPVAPVRLHTSPISPQTLRESYDSARLAAHNRTLQRKRPPSPATSNRKIWSTDEENALLEGLEYVRGPHWRDILSLYGEYGTRSDVLKRRSQVQLKDKARNMKLFFVKHGMEIPEVLRHVTGELKKARAHAGGEAVDKGEREVAEVAGKELDMPVSTDMAMQRESIPPDRAALVDMAAAIVT